MDFLQRLKDSINQIHDLQIKMKVGYLDDSESLVVYTLPNSAVKREYYDGTKELTLNLEIAIKSQDGQMAEATLWSISNYLESLTELVSSDDSFTFEDIEVVSRPFVNAIHEHGWLVFLLNAKANITQYQKENKK
ncbi:MULTISPECIES: minor capsid protein [unclassified Streptococcus]|uniref:minor capsid protein n=1 Tax=unclassified Streptococcus TaxID=2608887 RepID=UPI001071DE1C|nr:MULTISPECIES: minor capsid protein [unclassified Streptococcus]MBF0788164.1 minor capsid protein [Streptococcus sp. 19428wC2_LYSM12]MCQ9212283.1 minor capsid protein [Streptococcus sp. B01]MCQ9213614.1 minor capsid protein [Streptococcus sp. O1]TFV04765.1 capsid protein [Streptococcus sp. LYSM12]